VRFSPMLNILTSRKEGRCGCWSKVIVASEMASHVACHSRDMSRADTDLIGSVARKKNETAGVFQVTSELYGPSQNEPCCTLAQTRRAVSSLSDVGA
jgi:hypothetical protein